MAMTRKDYIVIADALLGARPPNPNDLRAWRQWETVADEIAVSLLRSYANFDLNRFQAYIKREVTSG